eukprot:556021-Pyramimonas_sp.AAC.1
MASSWDNGGGTSLAGAERGLSRTKVQIQGTGPTVPIELWPAAPPPQCELCLPHNEGSATVYGAPCLQVAHIIIRRPR